MSTRRNVVLSLLAPVLGGLLPAAPLAHAQTAVSTFTPQVWGTVKTADERVSCSGRVKVTTTAVTDPTQPPGVVVSVDARGLSCIGQLTGARYVNTGQANLTRLLVPIDVIDTTFAFHRDAAGGFLNARTALLTLILFNDTATGALTWAAGAVSNFQ